MAQITITLGDQTAATLAELAQRCAEADAERDGATTHGPLDVPALLAMLAEDAAMVIRRPGCWEADGMRQHLSAHGYEI